MKKKKSKEKEIIEFCETCENEISKCRKKCTGKDVKSGASDIWNSKK